MQRNLSEEMLKEKAKQLRASIVEMLYKAGSGHPGGSLSAIDILTVLYYNIMKQDENDINWSDRDRFILSKGHCAPALYSIFSDLNYFDRKELDSVRKFGSMLQGHPCMETTPGLEISSGSLGQGLSVAVGMALAVKLDKKDSRIYCMIGDGESQEGSIWEAAMCAGFYKLDNLCCILDNNHLQIDGFTDEVMNINPIKDKWLAFNWNVLEIDGHDILQIEDAFIKAKGLKGNPVMIIANTVKGKGVSYMENAAAWHGNTPNREQYEKAILEITGEEVAQ